MLRLSKNKGQSALEYALLIAVVIGALLAVNTYIQRGTQGRLKETADNIGKQSDPRTFTSDWKTAGGNTKTGKADIVIDGSKLTGNYTSTFEKRDTSSGDVANTTNRGEVVKKSEKDTWGTAPAHAY